MNIGLGLFPGEERRDDKEECRGPFPRASDPGSSVATAVSLRHAADVSAWLYEPPAAPVSALAMFVNTVLMF